MYVGSEVFVLTCRSSTSPAIQPLTCAILEELQYSQGGSKSLAFSRTEPLHIGRKGEVGPI